MEHQHLMQHRNPIQSHDMMLPTRQQQRPRSSPRRPPSRGRTNRGEESAAGAENRHHPGHIIQSRTSSQSHSLSKRARSRSRGRVNQQQQDQEHESSFNDSSNSRFNDSNYSMGSNMQMKRCSSLGNTASALIDERKITEYGRCIRHPNIELACKDPPNFSEWRVLLQDCPLCSLDANDGANMSHNTTTPSTNTNPTVTTEEESSVKSWTMSDGSDTEHDSDGNESRLSRPPEPLFNRQSLGPPEQSLKPRPPPPQRRRPPPSQKAQPVLHQQQNQQQQGNYIHQQQNQQQNYSNRTQDLNHAQAQASAFDPIQSLKELGKKLVQESEQAAAVPWGGDDTSVGMRSAASRRRPPPPPPPGARRAPPQDQRENDANDLMRRKDSISSLSTKELSQMKRQQQRKVHPPPRRGTVGSSAARGSWAGAEDSNDNLLGEASDIIARMESLTEGELATSSSRSRPMNIGEEAQDAIDAISRAEEEKKARALKRKEKAERKAARLRARQEMQQQRDQADGSQITTIPMNDVPTRRGRDVQKTDDILQAAAQIRARARRSTSRSRERIKEAAIFCGETPTESLLGNSNNDDEQADNNDHLSMCSEKKRSILNPHGLEEGPSPVRVERRSQSRERRRGNSGSSRRNNKGRDNADEQEAPVIGKRAARDRARRGSRGRDRDRENNNTNAGSYMSNQNQQTTAEELLSRRREMRQKIAERQSNVTSRRMEHNRDGSAGNGDDQLSLKEEVLEGWTRQNDAGSTHSRRSRGRMEERGRARGRSRSAVRDGLSKIRSASLNAFKKKGDKVIGGLDLGDEEVQTVDSGKLSKRSTRSSSSFKRLMSKGKPRSLSRSRHKSPTNILSDGVGRGHGDAPDGGGGWKARSETFLNETLGTTNEDHRRTNSGERRGADWEDSRSAAGRSEKSSSSSRLGMLKKSLTKKKKSKGSGSGLVRSLSRGSFRTSGEDNEPGGFTDDDRWDHGQDVMRSTNSTPATPAWLAEEIGSARSMSSGKPRGGGTRGRDSSNDFIGF